MPIPEDMRHTVQVKLRLSKKAAEVLRKLPSGTRSAHASRWILQGCQRLERAKDILKSAKKIKKVTK